MSPNIEFRRALIRAGRWTAFGLVWVAACLSPGCQNSPPAPEVELIGRRGVDHGHFSKPRAIEIDRQDRLYVVDMTGRIQVLDSTGKYLHSWRTPEIRNGKPCGLGFARDGTLMVADTHYFRVLFYSTDGELQPQRTLGGTHGRGPGEFGFLTDVAEDLEGNFYVAEYGDFDRIQKFDSRGQYLMEWGGHGSEPGQFLRPQALAIDELNRVWVADACNHRIQVFEVSGKSVQQVAHWGIAGKAPGELQYPYGIWLAPDQSVYVAEFGNHRIQKFTRDGRSLGCFGEAGRGPGQFHQPWSLALDSNGSLVVLDSYNHRLQRFRFPEHRVAPSGD